VELGAWATCRLALGAGLRWRPQVRKKGEGVDEAQVKVENFGIRGVSTLGVQGLQEERHCHDRAGKGPLRTLAEPSGGI
jgi:hypothetical protein